MAGSQTGGQILHSHVGTKVGTRRLHNTIAGDEEDPVDGRELLEGFLQAWVQDFRGNIPEQIGGLGEKKRGQFPGKGIGAPSGVDCV